MDMNAVRCLTMLDCLPQESRNDAWPFATKGAEV